MDDVTTIYDACINTTKLFEGADYDTITGNFDGQGMSFGVMQFNLKSETFKNYILAFCNPLSYDYFPVPIVPLFNLNGSDAVLWAKSIMLTDTGKVKPEWVTAWKRFLTQPDVINLQKNACGKYIHRAKELCGRFGFDQKNMMHMAYFYDCAVQVWSMDIGDYYFTKDQASNILTMYGTDNMNLWIQFNTTKEQQELVTIAHLRALKCKPEWKAAFFNRKATIALGVGIVNRQKFDFRKVIKGY
jgi:hypothetical protein